MTPGPLDQTRCLIQHVEHLLGRLYGRGWPARLLHRLGLQPDLTLRRHRVELPSRTDRPPLRLAFGSDFHAGPITHDEVLASAFEALAGLRPEVLLLGGDFVSIHARHVDVLVDLIRSVEAPLGRYAVLGNHDLWTSRGRVAAALEAAGVEVLTNRSVRLPPPWDDVWICGLDDPSWGIPDAEAATRDARGHRVVLMHSPDGLLALGERRFELALCGHTHGGQIALPGGRPIVLPRGRLCRRFAHGRHDVGVDGGGTLIVSRGVGNCATMPLRLNAAPDIVECCLVPGETGTPRITAEAPRSAAATG